MALADAHGSGSFASLPKAVLQQDQGMTDIVAIGVGTWLPDFSPPADKRRAHRPAWAASIG